MPRTPSGGKGKTDGRITPHMHGAKRVTKKAHVDLAPHVPKDTIVRVESDEEAIRLANDTEFGLAAYLYTRDLARSWRVTEALEYGIVGLNTGLISTEVAPFGGVKESGTGREGSKYGILEFTEIKYVCVGGI